MPPLLFDFVVLVVFLLMIVVLVAAHEYGHYVFARLCKMGIEEFAIGFGKPKLLVWRRKKSLIAITEEQAQKLEQNRERQELISGSLGFAQKLEGGGNTDKGERVVRNADGVFLEQTTEFTLRPWPLGGYVRLKGMMPEEDGSETQIPGGFYSRSPAARLLILFGGPLFSVLAGIAILIPYFMIVGQTEPVTAPVIGAVIRSMPADKAGIRPGDRVLSIEGKPVTGFYDVISTVRDEVGKHLDFAVNRDGKVLHFEVTPELGKQATAVFQPDLQPSPQLKVQGLIGVMYDRTTVRQSLAGAAKAAIEVPIQTVTGLAGGVLQPSTLKDQVGGPATMIKLTAAATESGVSQVILLACLISISVGILNLLPFPPLDGGQILVAFIELFRGGRRLSLKVQSVLATIGSTIVLFIIVSVVFLDFQKARADSGADSIQIETSKK